MQPPNASNNFSANPVPAVTEISLPPTADLAVAAFRLVVPSAITPRAILVRVPGSNSDGRPHADDPAWREWAAARQLALLGCHLQDQPRPGAWMEHYTRAADGSGQALLDALQKLADDVKRPGLAELPLILVGTSAGGQFAYEFVCWRPARALAFVAHKGGVYHTHLAPPEARRVPGLFFIGGDDLVHRRLSLTGIWSMGRRAGAHWALVDEPGVGHNEIAFANLTRTFLDDCLALRLSGNEIQPASTAAGWLIGCELKAPCPEEKDPHGAATTGWLPGRLSAEQAQPLAPKF
jgi:dienelactone hydrolase